MSCGRKRPLPPACCAARHHRTAGLGCRPWSIPPDGPAPSPGPRLGNPVAFGVAGPGRGPPAVDEAAAGGRAGGRELKRLLTGALTEQDLLGLLTAAGGGLSLQDLAELTGTRGLWEITETLDTCPAELSSSARHWSGTGRSGLSTSTCCPRGSAAGGYGLPRRRPAGPLPPAPARLGGRAPGTGLRRRTVWRSAAQRSIAVADCPDRWWCIESGSEVGPGQRRRVCQVWESQIARLRAEAKVTHSA